MKNEYKLLPKIGLKDLSRLPKYNIRSKYVANAYGDVYIYDKSRGTIKKDGKDHVYLRKMNPFKTKDGYLEYVLQDTFGKKKHIQGQRITAILFVPNPKKLPHVNHDDGVRDNNVASNLTWMSISDNNKHAYAKLGRTPWNKRKDTIKHK